MKFTEVLHQAEDLATFRLRKSSMLLLAFAESNVRSRCIRCGTESNRRRPSCSSYSELRHQNRAALTAPGPSLHADADVTCAKGYGSMGRHPVLEGREA